jgi:hypothetical protein
MTRSAIRDNDDDLIALNLCRVAISAVKLARCPSAREIMRVDITSLFTDRDGPVPNRHVAVDAVTISELAVRRLLPLIRRPVIPVTGGAGLNRTDAAIKRGQAV